MSRGELDNLSQVGKLHWQAPAPEAFERPVRSGPHELLLGSLA